jgi:hypothetical protein
MKAVLLTRSAKPTAKGVLSLKFSCTGTAMKGCKVTIFIDFNGTSVASRTVLLAPGKKSVITVRLNRKGLALLLKKKKLKVDVGYSVQDGFGDVDFNDQRVGLVAPKVKAPLKSKTVAPKRK